MSSLLDLTKCSDLLLANEGVRNCASKSSLGSIVCAGTASVCGFAFGPIGLLVGGTIGGFFGWYTNQGTYIGIEFLF